MRNIKYVKKDVNASTEYRQTTRDDLEWVLDQCRNIVATSDACGKSKNRDLLAADDILNMRNPRIPRQSGGRINSARSMCEGTLENFARGQYDLSSKTCAGVEEAFRIAASIFDEFEEVTFEQVEQLPRLVAPIRPASALNDLWEHYEIVTTIRKKT